MTPESLKAFEEKIVHVQRKHDAGWISHADQSEILAIAGVLLDHARRPETANAERPESRESLETAQKLLDQAEVLAKDTLAALDGSVPASDVASDLEYAIAALLDVEARLVDRIANAVAILVRMQCRLEHAAAEAPE